MTAEADPNATRSGPRAATTRLGPLLIAALYVAVSVVYILVSDRIVDALVSDPALNSRVQSIKGVAFVTCSGGLIWFLVARLVRSLRAANDQLVDRGARVRALLDGAPVPLVVLRDGRFEYMNIEGCRLLGTAGHHSMSFEQTLLDESRDRVRAMLARVAAGGGGEWLTDLRLRAANGHVFDAELAASQFALESGALQIVILDVTERRQLELAVRQAQKMEAVGRLASGVAHEFNNMLTAIIGLAAMVRAESASGQSYLQQIERVAEQAADLTRSLLTMSRAVPAQKHSVRLQDVLLDAATMIRGAIPGNISFEVRLDALDDATAIVDVAQLRQALLNLSINARDAMPLGGSLRFAAFQSGAESDEAVIELQDSGSGMTGEVLSQIFTPFFTTKQAGKGTGLGLAVTRGIIEEHQGRIVAESEVGRGTIFRITLPLVREPVAV